MSYKPPYTITPKITNLVAQISEAIGGYYAHENLRLHRVNRIKTIHGTLAIGGNTLSTEQVTAVLEGKPVVAPINEVQEVRNALKAYELLDTLDPCKVDDLLKAHATMEAGLIDEIGCCEFMRISHRFAKFVWSACRSSAQFSIPFSVGYALCDSMRRVLLQ